MEKKKLFQVWEFSFCIDKVILYGSWISNYLWTQCLSPLMLWVRTLLRPGVLDTLNMMKFASDLRQVGGFLQVRFPPPIKLTAMI
jgi:hypothetical protein